MNTTNPLLLRTHCGQPHAVVNTDDARERGMRDGDADLRVMPAGGPPELLPRPKPPGTAA